MDTFYNLPSDVVFHIIDQIEDERDVSSLSRTSRAIHRVANPYFYSRHVRLHKSWALCWAAREDRVDTARLLLSSGGDANTLQVDYAFQHPVAIAAIFGSVEMTRLLLGTEGVDPEWTSWDGVAPLSHAASSGNEEVVKLYLADTRVDPRRRDKGGNTALAHASGECEAEAVQLLLLDKRVDPSIANNAGCTPLMSAAGSEDDNTDVVRLLLADPRIEVNRADESGITALHHAVYEGHSEHVRLLLEAGADVNALNDDANTPLHDWALAKMRDESTLAFLLAAPGIDVNAAGEFGQTALMRAVRGQTLERVSLLLRDARVDVNATDHEGMTALMLAARDVNNDACVRMLLAREDIVVEQGPESRHFLLQLGIADGSFATVKVLLGDERVRTRYKDESGLTPFLYAVACGYADSARILHESGRCSVDDCDEQGRNAWGLAKEDDYEDVIRMLLAIQDEEAWKQVP